MHVAFIDVDGLRTRYIRSGQGEPVVLLHGIGMSADGFHRNMDDIAAMGRSAYAMDMIGHGFTDHRTLDAGDPLGSLADHVIAFARTLGLGRVDMVGSSLGGGVAVESVLRAPDLVRSCVVVGSSTPFVAAAQLGAGLTKARQNAAESFRHGTRDALRKRLRHLVHDEASVSEELIAVQLTIYAEPDRATAYDAIVDGVVDAPAGARVTASARLDEVSVPVLAIAGREDPRSPLDAISAGVARLRRGELVVYDRCGHFPFLEDPGRFAGDVGAFWRRLDG